jgi:hypothetical protein
MEEQINKALEEARLQNEAKNKLSEDLKEFIDENYIIENGTIKEKKNESGNPS